MLKKQGTERDRKPGIASFLLVSGVLFSTTVPSSGLGGQRGVEGAGEADEGWSRVVALLADEADQREAAFEAIAADPDPALMAGLSDVLYFYYVSQNEALARRVSELMETVSGDAATENPRRGWAEWVGRHEEIRPREGYLPFKRSVFTLYDPAFRQFLNPRFELRIRPEEIEWGGVTKDGIPALQNPGHMKASEADYLNDEDRVFGVFVNGEARAYPHRIMDWHEMCNDLIGGVPISLSYCTLCGSGILFKGDHVSRAGKDPFTFGSSGLLYRSNKLMYDQQTRSLWNNLTGEPVGGRLATSGIRLEVLPNVVSTWGDWKKLHPDTLVLDVEKTGHERDYRQGPYEAYFASTETMFPVWLTNDALAAKAWVYALIVNGRPKAYPLDALKRERVSHDALGGKSIVLVTNEETGAVRAYEAGELHFEPAAKADSLREVGTGELWRVGEPALTSPSGETRMRLPGHKAFWFGWYAFYPTTEIYGK